MILSFFTPDACVEEMIPFKLARLFNYRVIQALGKMTGHILSSTQLVFSAGNSLLSYLWLTAVTCESCQSSKKKTSSDSGICS